MKGKKRFVPTHRRNEMERIMSTKEKKRRI